MITILLILGLLVLFGVPTIVLCAVWKGVEFGDKKYDIKLAFVIIASVAVIAMIIAGFISIILSAETNQYDVLDARYEQLVETFDFYRKNTRTDGNAWLLEVYNYNNKVIELQTRYRNPWTSCFVNAKRVKQLKLIEFDNGTLKKGV